MTSFVEEIYSFYPPTHYCPDFVTFLSHDTCYAKLVRRGETWGEREREDHLVEDTCILFSLYFH